MSGERYRLMWASSLRLQYQHASFHDFNPLSRSHADSDHAWKTHLDKFILKNPKVWYNFSKVFLSLPLSTKVVCMTGEKCTVHVHYLVIHELSAIKELLQIIRWMVIGTNLWGTIHVYCLFIKYHIKLHVK